jgi:hypothetical protein
MVRSIAFASLAALVAVAAVSSAAAAQEMIDATGVLAPRLSNIVGGGSATVVGSGDDMVIEYSRGGAGGASPARPGPIARSDGDRRRRRDDPAAATDPAGTSREGWLSGAGDDAQVTYADPRARRRR